MEVRLRRFKKIKMVVESGKNGRLGKTRRGMGIRCWCRVDVGDKAPTLEEIVKMDV